MHKIIESLPSNLKIGIVGDSMLDEYFNVNVRKISPEFPIPVMHSEESSPTEILPGGAANVAYQFQHINKNTYLCSFLDNQADDVLKKYNINTSLSVNINPYLIPRKKRFYSSDFPTYRWDVEKFNCGMNDSTLMKACEKLRQNILSQSFDVLIFSDYDKGLFYNSVVSSLAKDHPCSIRIVDPKKDIFKWHGCTLIKPNTLEAFAITNQKDKREQIKSILNQTNCSQVIITSEGNGFVGYDEDYFEHHNKRKIQQANSVIGAGDCFIAFLGLCLGNKVPLKESAEFAFSMGLIYVTEKHNKPLDINIIKKDIYGNASKIIDYKQLKNRDFKLVVTNGCFDILHAGHLTSLEFAKKQGDKLLVAVNSDESISRLKPNRPINKLDHRMTMLASLECVDYVSWFDGDTPLNLMQELKPDILVKGEDYKNKEVVGLEYSGKVVFAPFVDGLSTTKIIESIKKSNLSGTSSKLSDDFNLSLS